MKFNVQVLKSVWDIATAIPQSVNAQAVSISMM